MLSDFAFNFQIIYRCSFSNTVKVLKKSFCDQSTDGLCYFPSTWDGVWYDSGMGNITLDRNMHRVTSGWTFQVHGTQMETWTCQNQINDTDTMLFK